MHVLDKDEDVAVPSVLVTFEFGRFVCDCPYEDRGIPKAAGFWWDRRRRAWYTWDARIASGLIGFADREAKKRILDKIYGPGFGSDTGMRIPSKGGRINPVRHS